MKYKSEELRDGLFLCCIVFLSILFYVTRIGFYSDDWAFFGASFSSPDRSLIGLFRSFNGPVVWMRPVQVFYLALLYKLFDLNPPGYHVVNHIVFLCGILLFYKVLRILVASRSLSVVIPAIFATLPHYSTDRFWPILFCANLSMTTYFLSLYCDLRMLRSSGGRIWIWKFSSVISLLVGTLAYEVFLPFFLLNLFLVLRRNQKMTPGIPKLKALALLSLNVIAIAFVIIFKAFITTRMIMQGPSDHLIWILHLMTKAFAVSFGKYGLEIPLILKKIISSYFNWKTFAVSLVSGVIIYVYLFKVSVEPPQNKQMLSVTASGLFVFVLGYAIFITNENADPSIAGLNNRTAIAAAMGVAISFAGICGWVGAVLRSRRLFALLVSFVCASGVLMTYTIADFWIAAYDQQLKVLTGIQKQFPGLEPNSTIILDGVCPYSGPGIIFESQWDLAGALKVYYRDYSLKADVVRPTIKITENGIQTTLYNGVATYPYANLYAYHHGRNISRKLNSQEDARKFFQTYDPYFGLECADSKEGDGVPIF